MSQDQDAPDRYRTVDARFAPSIDPDAPIDASAFLTVDTVDADNEVVLPGGCDLGRFARNAPVMVCHDWMRKVAYYPLPVGQVLWTKIRPRGIMGGIKFAAGTEMGREVKALVDDGILRGVSIGMKVVEQSAMTRSEAESRPDWKAAFERAKGRINVIRKCVLLELSVVPIPSNEDALIQTLKAKGLSRPAWVAPATTNAREVQPVDKPADVTAETPVDDEVITKAAEVDDGDDPDDDAEDDGPVRKGDFVRAVRGPYKGVVGKVKSVHRGGPVPDVEDDVMGTREAPAARVCCYKAMGDGHKETGHHVACKALHLEKIDDLKGPKQRAKAAAAPAADRGKAVGIEILPGEVRTDEEVAAARAAAVKAATSPEIIARMAKSLLDELTGAV